MNPSKRNGWILCPSKRFPGKFYFFNAINGEALWDLNDLERTPMQRNIHKVTNKWHDYPEPDIPPDNPNVNWHYNACNFEKPVPLGPHFGQPAFPGHQETLNKNVMWIPVQKPPTISNNQESFHHKNWPDGQLFQNCATPGQRYIWLEKPTEIPDNMSYRNLYDVNNKWTNSHVFAQKTPSKIMTNQIFGQKREILRSAQFEIKRPECQTALRPMFNRRRTKSESQGYMNFEPQYREASNDNLSLDDSYVGIPSPIKRPPFPTQARGSLFSHEEPDYDPWDMTNINPIKKLAKSETNIFGNVKLNRTRPMLHLTKSQNGNYFMPNLSPVKRLQFPQMEMFPNKILSKSIDDVTIEDTRIKLSNLCPRKWLENSLKTNEGKENLEFQKDGVNLKNLDKNDLRYLLLAKKRKSENPDVRILETGKRKIIPNDTNEAVPPKKRVTFDLDYVEVSDHENQLDDDIDDPVRELQQDLTIETLRDLAVPTVNADRWYIAVDKDVLLEDFGFIDEYVKTDDKCSLLIAPIVRSEIEAMSVGDCRGRPHVMSARQLSRLFAAPSKHITVLPADETNELSTDNAILSSCMQMINQNYHVVLIVKNPELYNETNLNINCFGLQEIKNGAAISKPEIFFELKKTQSCFNNDNMREKNNAFLKPANEFNPFAIKNKEPVNCFWTGPFDQHNNSHEVLLKINNNSNIMKPSKMTENTKIIFPPKITQSNQKVTFENENNVLPMTSQISQQNLNVKETFDIQKDSLAENKNCSSFQDSNQPQIENSCDIKKIQIVNSYNIEEHLKRFCIKNEFMEEIVQKKMDQWICYFTQIMEDILSDVLRVSPTSPSMPPPWSLSEAIECVRELFGQHVSIRILDEKLSDLLSKLKPTMLSSDFMKIFGCGVLLIKTLKTIVQHVPELTEAENSLADLLLMMEDPSEPEPLVMIRHKPASDADYEDLDQKKNFIKKPSEVLVYLKTHFPGWQTHIEAANCCDNIEEKPQQEKPTTKIVRTLGRNLNIVKLGKNKTMSMNHQNCTDSLKIHSTDTQFREIKEIDLEKREAINKDMINMLGCIVNGEVHTFNYVPKVTEKKVKNNLSIKKDITDKINNIETTYDNLCSNNQGRTIKDVEPKVIRITQPIQSFDEHLKRNEQLDMDVLDYDEFDGTSLMVVANDDINENVETAKNDVIVRNDNYSENDGDFSNDSGCGYEIRHAPSIVITFLWEVSRAIKIIYKFINASIVEYRKDDIQEDKKTVMHEKTKMAHTQIGYIIDRLKSIIQRESVKGSTLAELMESAGIDVTADIRLSRYRQVVTKCLEQAEILENALKVMLSIADADFDAATTIESVSSSIKYINIFEN